MIKHIFSDMDGTILNDIGEVTDQNADLIKASKIPVTLVSARAPIEMQAAIDKLNLTGPQIGFNGGLIFKKLNDDLKIIEKSPIDFHVGQKLVDEVKQNFPSISLSWYTLNHWYSERIDDGIRLENKYTSLLPNIVKSKQFFDEDHELFKLMMIIFDSEVMRNVKNYLIMLNLPGITIQQSSDTYLEITSDKAIKSRGLQFIIEQEKLQKNEMMAFGDGHNDLPMLEMVDYPVAMKNSLPEVLKMAKYQTDTNENNGVGLALKKYLPKLN